MAPLGHTDLIEHVQKAFHVAKGNIYIHTYFIVCGLQFNQIACFVKFENVS